MCVYLSRRWGVGEDGVESRGAESSGGVHPQDCGVGVEYPSHCQTVTQLEMHRASFNLQYTCTHAGRQDWDSKASTNIQILMEKAWFQ